MNREQSIISAIVLLVIQAAAFAGHTLDEGTVTTVVTAIVTLAVTAWSIWKNHNFTDAALAAQQFLDAAKGADVEEEDIDADDAEDESSEVQPAGTDGGDE